MTILTTFFSVDGVSRRVAVENTSEELAQAYDSLVNQIAGLAAKTSSDFDTATAGMTQAQMDAYAQAQFANFRALLGLASNGLVVGGKQYYLTQEMAAGVDDLVRSAKAAGWDPTSASGNATETVAVLRRWSDLYNFGLNNIVAGAQKATDLNLNIQDLVESEYVSTGNHIIFNALSDLESQLDANQKALESLTSLQDIMNMVTSALNNNTAFQNQLDAFVSAWGTIPASPSPPFTGGSDAGAYDTAYTNATQDLFGKAIGVVAPDGTQNSQVLSDFKSAYQGLVDQIANLKASIGDDPGSLTAALEQIKSDIDSAAVPAYAVTDMTDEAISKKFAAWIIDNMGVTEVGKAAVAGNFQRNLTKAITQSENLNDTQKTRLQSQLFVFQEFYQSASSILTALNTAITTMAQNISQG
jgi:hypothetical protein